jgi:predicted HNH restriction endonuclease
MTDSRYPDDWDKIAFEVKEKADWQCAKCRMQCLKPGENIAGLTKSERTRKTLTVHHANYQPEDNRLENLIPLCTGCHLSLHTDKRGNISVGQLKLFAEEGYLI